MTPSFKVSLSLLSLCVLYPTRPPRSLMFFSLLLYCPSPSPTVRSIFFNCRFFEKDRDQWSEVLRLCLHGMVSEIHGTSELQHLIAPRTASRLTIAVHCLQNIDSRKVVPKMWKNCFHFDFPNNIFFDFVYPIPAQNQFKVFIMLTTTKIPNIFYNQC